VSDDPFDDLDPHPDDPSEDDHSGDDPFEDLGADAEGTPTDVGPDESGSWFDDEPTRTDRDAGPGVPEEASGPGTPRRADDLFADLDRSADTDGPLDDVWEELSVDWEPGQIEDHEGKRLSEVSKHSFCERCPHFTGPPRIACTHDGTEILEFVDMETVRVADCPIVAERKRLRQTTYED